VAVSPNPGLHDTWTWDGKFWAQRQDIGPAGRGHYGLAWDEVRDRIVLFGGQAVGNVSPGAVLADT
jgi:hypothetical protein